ncbi:Fanconi anemia group C protein [Varanus komodoensis]|nr:Fanconi anemia group C protein [Varanus komodoensis]
MISLPIPYKKPLQATLQHKVETNKMCDITILCGIKLPTPYIKEFELGMHSVLQNLQTVKLYKCLIQRIIYLFVTFVSYHPYAQMLSHQAACHPVIFRTADEIFKNALLETDGASEVMTVMQVFTQCFVQAYHENNKQHKFPLKAYFPNNPHSLVMAFLKHPSDLPAAGLYQHLNHIAEILKATVEAEDIRSCSDLFENWFLFLHFGEWVDVAAEELLVSQAESSDALLWLLAFYYNPSDENQQRTQTMVEVRSVCDHLRILSRKPAVSITDLQTIVTGKMNIRQEGIKHLVMHLIISFLLFIPGGHAIAKEFTVHFVIGGHEIPEVKALLIRLSNRVRQLGVKYQRTLKVANDLLQKLNCETDQLISATKKSGRKSGSYSSKHCCAFLNSSERVLHSYGEKPDN